MNASKQQISTLLSDLTLRIGKFPLVTSEYSVAEAASQCKTVTSVTLVSKGECRLRNVSVIDSYDANARSLKDKVLIDWYRVNINSDTVADQDIYNAVTEMMGYSPLLYVLLMSKNQRVTVDLTYDSEIISLSTDISAHIYSPRSSERKRVCDEVKSITSAFTNHVYDPPIIVNSVTYKTFVDNNINAMKDQLKNRLMAAMNGHTDHLAGVKGVRDDFPFMRYLHSEMGNGYGTRIQSPFILTRRNVLIQTQFLSRYGNLSQNVYILIDELGHVAYLAHLFPSHTFFINTRSDHQVVGHNIRVGEPPAASRPLLISYRDFLTTQSIITSHNPPVIMTLFTPDSEYNPCFKGVKWLMPWDSSDSNTVAVFTTGTEVEYVEQHEHLIQMKFFHCEMKRASYPHSCTHRSMCHCWNCTREIGIWESYISLHDNLTVDTLITNVGTVVNCPPSTRVRPCIELVRASALNDLRYKLWCRLRKIGYTISKEHLKTFFSFIIYQNIADGRTENDDPIFPIKVEFADELSYISEHVEASNEMIKYLDIDGLMHFEDVRGHDLYAAVNSFIKEVKPRDTEVSVSFKENSVFVGKYEIPRILYSRLRQCADDMMIHTLLIRYIDVLGSTNTQLSLPFYGELINLFNASVECFASPLNNSLRIYYSCFHDIDKYFGSRGNFFSETQFFPRVYVAFPPFENYIVTHTLRKVRDIMQVQPDASFLLFLPQWDMVTSMLESMEHVKVVMNLSREKLQLYNATKANYTTGKDCVFVYVSRSEIPIDGYQFMASYQA